MGANDWQRGGRDWGGGGQETELGGSTAILDENRLADVIRAEPSMS
jgi:hypothetical protein